MPRAFHRSRRRGVERCCSRATRGFALPVAVGSALLLLLSSSALQLMALQSRVHQGQQQRRFQLEDSLASAAQQQAAALQLQAPCLLQLDLQQWSGAAAACNLSAAGLAQLQHGQVGQLTYRLTAYQVQGNGAGVTSAAMEVQLQGDRPWRARYRLVLAPVASGAVQITAVEELGLRGGQA